MKESHLRSKRSRLIHPVGWGLLLVAFLFFGVFPSSVQAGRDAFGHYQGNEWLTEWWSWPFWWEANREQFLKPPAHQAPPSSKVRAAAVQALRKALGDDRPVSVRAAAALALGRMEEASAAPRLIQLTSDKSIQVRRSAWMALGLIGNPPARAKIKAAMDQTDMGVNDTTAWIASVALLHDPGRDLLKAMLNLVHQHRSEYVQRMAMWALRVQHPPGLAKFARRVIATTHDARICDQAVQVLGEVAQTQPSEQTIKDAQLLVKMYDSNVHGGNSAAALAYFHRLYWRPIGIFGDYWAPIIGLRTSAAVAMRHFQFPEDDRRGEIIRRALRRSYEIVQDSRSGRRRYRVEHSSAGFELRFGLIALGTIGYEQDSETLIDMLRGKYEDFADDAYPGRGFAAMGLGIYLRRTNAVHAQRQRGDDVGDQRRRIIRALAYVGKDRGEQANLRAACALALGMSDDPQCADEVKAIVKSLGGGDRLAAGYAVLALGMLHDKDALLLARKMLPHTPGNATAQRVRKTAFRQKITVGQALTRRAVILGLGCLGDKQAVGLLEGQPHTSMELIRSLRWCGDEEIGTTLAELLNNPGGKPDVARLSAWSLGELLDAHQPSRLYKAVMKDVNLTLPVSIPSGSRKEGPMWRKELWPLYRYRCYANEFLFRRLNHESPERNPGLGHYLKDLAYHPPE